MKLFAAMQALVNQEMSRFIGDNVDGMVGYDFLRDYDIQMDFSNQAINFYPGGSLDIGAIYGSENMTCVQVHTTLTVSRVIQAAVCVTMLCFHCFRGKRLLQA